MTDEKDDKKPTNWPEWIRERIGSGSESVQKSNLVFGKIGWCNAFDRGDQYKILNETTGMIEDVYTTRETRCLYNIIKTFNDAYAAKMWKGNPIPTTTPFSTNTEDYDEDVNVATNAGVEYWWKTSANGSVKGYDTIRTGAVGGIAYAKVYYDKNKKSGMYTGEVVWEKLNPLHCHPNADATCDEEFREFNHRYPLEKSVAEERWSEQMKKLGIKELQTSSKNDAHPEETDASKKLDDTVNAEVKYTVIVNDIWIKKCKKYPNGKHVVVIGQDTLVDEDNPEPDMLPFFANAVNPIDGHLVGTGVTYPIIPIQRDMNKLNSIISENSDYMGHLMWLVKEGSITNPSGIGDLAGQYLEYSGDKEPTQSRANPLPVHITGRFWELMEMAKFITKIQALDLGTIPKGGSQMSNQTTGRLTESEEVMFAPEVERWKNFFSKIINRQLYLSKEYYAEDRIVKIVGENKRPEAIIFKHEQLDDNYNVDTKLGQGFARSDEAQVAAITNLMQTPAWEASGIDPKIVMSELLKKNGLTKIKEDTFKDERQAKRFLRFIVENPGKDYPINRYVDPMAHIRVFTDYTKQPEFDIADPLIRGAIEKYIDRMVEMTMPPPQPTPGGGGNGIGTPGNMPSPVPNPNEQIDLGGRPPEPIIAGQAEDMASTGV
jgi:hypothetical protein